MNDFLESIIKRDPAAKSKLSIILTYPGVKAVFFHKIANFFSIAKFDLIARIISQFSRFLTGIEIHPKAKIGNNLFIDNMLKNDVKLISMGDNKLRLVTHKDYTNEMHDKFLDILINLKF